MAVGSWSSRLYLAGWARSLEPVTLRARLNQADQRGAASAVSSSPSAFQWLVGYYYADFTDGFYAPFDAAGAESLFGTTNLLSQQQVIKLSPSRHSLEIFVPADATNQGEHRRTALFVDEDVKNAENGVLGPTGSDAIVVYFSSERHQGVDPRFELSYQPSDNLLLYTSAAKGFRPGGGNNSVPTSGPVGITCEQNLQTVIKYDGICAGPEYLWAGFSLDL